MTNIKIPNPATGSPSLIAGDHGRVAGLGLSSRRPTMNRYVKGQTYGQRIKALLDLLQLYGRLNPGQASRTLEGMTIGLVAEIKRDHPDCAVQEVAQ